MNAGVFGGMKSKYQNRQAINVSTNQVSVCCVDIDPICNTLLPKVNNSNSKIAYCKSHAKAKGPCLLYSGEWVCILFVPHLSYDRSFRQLMRRVVYGPGFRAQGNSHTDCVVGWGGDGGCHFSCGQIRKAFFTSTDNELFVTTIIIYPRCYWKCKSHGLF